MVRKLCLDSDVLIALIRGEPRADVLDTLDAEFCVSAVNVFEVWLGRKSQEKISELLATFITLDLTRKCAQIAADIRRELQNKGEDLDLRDIFIAAICIGHDVPLLTFNTKHFSRLQKFGLQLA